MERDRFRLKNIDCKSKRMYMKLCECKSRLLGIPDCKHLTVFHPQLITYFKKISEKVKTAPDIMHKYPSMDCGNLCAAKVIANRLIENLTICDRSSLGLIQQLSEKITNVSDINLTSADTKVCHLCGLHFPATYRTIVHLKINHPGCLSLIQFLQCRPLSELNFPQELIKNVTSSSNAISVRNQTKLLELVRRVREYFVSTSPRPKTKKLPVKKKKLPSHLHHECITEGFKMKENPRILSDFDAQPNPRLRAIRESLKKIRGSGENSPLPCTSNIAVDVVPERNLKTPREISETHFRTRRVRESSVSTSPRPKKKKLLSHLHQEGITEGFKVKENPHILSDFDAQPNPRLRVIRESLEKIRRSGEISPLPCTSNIAVDIVPEKNLKTPREISDSETHKKVVKNSTPLTKSHRVMEVKIDQLMKHQENEKALKKEEVLTKVHAKCHEKETKKEVLYRQEMLRRYVVQHRNFLFKLESDLINARERVTSSLNSQQLLERVNFYVLDDKVKKNVAFLLKKLFDAMEFQQ